MTDHIAHFDDVPVQAIATGDLRGQRQRLGSAARAPRLGLSRYVLGPDERPMPVHTHADEEEFVFVLAGSGVSTAGSRAWRIGAGDVVVHPPGGSPHTFLAGSDGLEVLVFSSGSDTNLTWLPRPDVMWAGSRWLPPGGPNPFAAEAACGPYTPPALLDERPVHIVALDDVELVPRDWADMDTARRYTGRAAGAVRSGLTHSVTQPGARATLPHTHSSEDELFVVLDGAATLELLDADAQPVGAYDVRAGHVISRPAGTGVAHSLLAGPDGLTMLAYGHRDPSDMCFYPRSQKVWLRGLGDVVVRVDRQHPADGEG